MLYVFICIGETPSKRRRTSSETTPKSTTDTDSDDKVSSKDSTEDIKDSAEPESDDKKQSDKEKDTTPPKPRSSEKIDSEPNIKDNLGSPRPLTRSDSPQPGTSKGSTSRQNSCSEDSEGAGSQRQHRRSGEEDLQRSRVREKPFYVDLVAKHIESLFAILAKNDDN